MREVAVGSLSAAEGGGVAVGAEEDAGEDDFDVAARDEAARFFEHFLHGFAEKRRPQFGDDAVGAVGVAAVLDFEVGALSAGLVLAQKGQRVGAGL